MKTKKFISLLSAIIMIVTFSIGTKANGLRNEIDQSLVLSEANVFISEISEADECPWNTDTLVSEIVPVYGTNNLINGYILNLETVGEETGYVFIDTVIKSEPEIIQFGFDDEYYLTDNNIFPELETKRIVYLGMDLFAYKEKGKYYKAQTGERITENVNKIRKDWEDSIESLAGDLEASNNYVSLMVSYPPSGSGISGTYVDGIWSGTEFEPWTMDTFEGLGSGYTNHCAPTCGTNMLKYWRNRRGITDLFIKRPTGEDHIGGTFMAIADCMNWSSIGTQPRDAYTGLGVYLSQYSRTMYKGRDYRERESSLYSTFNWEWIKTQVNNGNPMYTSSGGHAYFSVGYFSDSTGSYLCVNSQWNTSSHNYLQYQYSNIRAMWYNRW